MIICPDVGPYVRLVSNLFILLLFPAVSGLAEVGQTSGPQIEAGRRVNVRLEQWISTRTASSGDRVTALFEEGVRSGSAVVLPRGTRLEGKVESVQSASPNTDGWIRLLFDEVLLPDGRRVRAQFSNLFSASESHPMVRYFVPMAIGAATGAVIGGREARVSGILGGLLAGSVIGFGGSRSIRNIDLPAGRRISLRLGQNLQIPAVE